MHIRRLRRAALAMAAVVGIGLVAAATGCHGSTPEEPKGVPGYYPGVNVQRKQAERQQGGAATGSKTKAGGGI